MPYVTVFRDNEQIDQMYFTGHFYIEVSDQDEAVFWREDAQEWHYDRADGLPYEDATRPYMHVWLQGSLNLQSYMLPLLRHDWILEAEGQRCEVGFCDAFSIIWHEVTLHYRVYRFCFVFEYLEKNTQAPLPKPIKMKEELDDLLRP